MIGYLGLLAAVSAVVEIKLDPEKFYVALVMARPVVKLCKHVHAIPTLVLSIA